MTRASTHPIGAPALAVWVGALAVTVGVAVLVGWALDISFLKSVLPGWVAMKPTTAVAFMLAGVAVLLSAAPVAATHRYSARASRLCGLTTGLIGLLSLSEYAFGWNPGFDQWLFPEPAGAVGTSNLGRMAPDTAICFMLFTAGWESASRSRPMRWTLVVSLLSGAVMTVIALAEVLSYFSPSLRTYGWGGLTMMALPTAIIFAALGATLVGIAVRREASAATGAPTKLFLVFAALTIGILAFGTFYYRNGERTFRVEAEHQLSAIADLKAGEVVLWRQERLSDARLLFKNTAISALVRRILEPPGDVGAKRELQMWFEKFVARAEYDQIRLLDAQGVTRVSTPAALTAPATILDASAREAARSGQVALQDFYLTTSGQVRLALLIPVLDERDGNRPLGVLVLRINPATYLYPFIERWPTSSQTAETLLVRRDGDDALFLNTLLFRKQSAMTLRLPLTRTDVPAVQAVLGREGLTEGRDYRGIAVFAALRAIPDSPWRLVARVDTAEVFAPLRAQLWQVVAMVATLIFAAGAGVGLIWRQQRVRFYREQVKAGEVLRESELKFRTLFESTSDAHLLFADGRWVDCNKAATKIFGCSREQIIGAHPSQFSPPTQPDGRSSEEEAIKKIALALTAETQEFEWEHRRLDGTLFPAEVHLVRVDLGGKPHIQAIVRDVSERQRAAAALQMERQNLDALFESSPVALLVLDATTAIVKVNLAALALTGGSESEFVKHRPGNALRCVHSATDPRGCGYGKGCPLCPARNAIEALIANGGTVHGAEIPLELIRNGAPERVYLRIGAEPVMLNGIRHLLVAMDDVTERRQVADRILQFNAALEQRVAERTSELAAANRELEAFSYSVSHDLRAPLRSIDGFSRIVQEDYAAKLDDEGRDHLTRVRAAAQRMGQLIDALLDLSRVGRAELRREQVDLSTVARAVAADLHRREPDRAVELILADGPAAEGDPRLLRVVLDNLLGNAWKFTSKCAHARIEFGAVEHDGHTAWFVRDNGAGFDPAHAAKLFGAFQRLHSVEEFAGTGIGLATVQRIIRRHGGRVWAEGTVDQGATFWFDLGTPEASARTRL